ncbi:hypothetical protein RJT34_23253 [Clitoria ternatea]|uniref:Uncharacterized protein n=1 Tax=Clitoria ternatea TaxID=43366 RepID=A0AAN9IGD1_CLITE
MEALLTLRNISSSLDSERKTDFPYDKHVLGFIGHPCLISFFFTLLLFNFQISSQNKNTSNATHTRYTNLSFSFIFLLLHTFFFFLPKTRVDLCTIFLSLIFLHFL